ncbi:hypothetical protein Avbf_11779 [Armadillidium vulgare]|nr:hypothetical protein Avbf_11779 [Armadillidium vulgare]
MKKSSSMSSSTSCIRRAVNKFPNWQKYKLITSGLYLLPINEEHLALKKRRLPEASLRSIFQKEKIRWARHHCQDTKRLGVGLLIKCNQAWSFQSKHPRVLY